MIFLEGVDFARSTQGLKPKFVELDQGGCSRFITAAHPDIVGCKNVIPGRSPGELWGITTRVSP